MRGGIGGEFWPGLLMLILYWSTSTVAVYLFKPKDRREDTYSLYLSALNFVLFFFLARYQVGAEHPELRMFIIEALALAYVGLVFLSNYLRRQNLYTLNLVTAALCTTMSLYYLLDKGNWVAIGWLIQAEALYIAGLLADETRFRVIGAANFVLVGIWLSTGDYNVPDQAHCSG
jgi:hypothetical protein